MATERDKINRVKEKAIMHSLGLKYGLTDKEIANLLNSPYELASDIIYNLDIDSIKTPEDLVNTRTNFYFKGLGTIHIPYYMFEYRNRLRERMKQINKNK